MVLALNEVNERLTQLTIASEEDVRNLQDVVQTLQSLQTSVSNAQTSISNLNTSMTQSIQGVDTKVGQLQTSTQSSFNTVNSSISTANTNISALQTKTNTMERSLNNICTYKNLGDNYVMNAADMKIPGFYKIEGLADTVIYNVKNRPEHEVGDYYLIVATSNYYFQVLYMTTPRLPGITYVGRFWDNVFRGWETITDAFMVSNPNLLLNSNFRINQRDSLEYVGSKYTVDRWHSSTFGKLQVNRNTGVCTYSANGGNAFFEQYLIKSEYTNNLKDVDMAATLILDPNTHPEGKLVCYATYRGAYGLITKAFLPNGAGIRIYDNDVNGRFTYQVYVPNGTSISFLAAKLEIGKVATAYSPPNPEEELLRCQYYYEEGTSTTLYPLSQLIPTYIEGFRFISIKRVLPSVKIIAYSGKVGTLSYANGTDTNYGINTIDTSRYGVNSFAVNTTVEYANSYCCMYVADAEIY